MDLWNQIQFAEALYTGYLDLLRKQSIYRSVGARPSGKADGDTVLRLRIFPPQHPAAWQEILLDVGIEREIERERVGEKHLLPVGLSFGWLATQPKHICNMEVTRIFHFFFFWASRATGNNKQETTL